MLDFHFLSQYKRLVTIGTSFGAEDDAFRQWQGAYCPRGHLAMPEDIFCDGWEKYY